MLRHCNDPKSESVSVLHDNQLVEASTDLSGVTVAPFATAQALRAKEGSHMAGGAGGMPVLPAWATFGVCRIMHAFDQDRDGILSLTEFNNFQVGSHCVVLHSV